MKKILLLLLSFYVLCSCTTRPGKDDKEFLLKGEIIGQDSGKITLRYMPKSTFVVDTVEIIDGKFIFTGTISEPTYSILFTTNPREFAEIYLEPGSIKLTIGKDNFKDIKVTGSKTQKELNQFNKMTAPILKRLEMVREQIIKNRDSVVIFKEETKLNLINRNYDELKKIRTEIMNDFNSAVLEFIHGNPKSYLAPFYLGHLSTNIDMSLDSIKLLFNRLDKSIQNSRHGQNIQEEIRRRENMLLGAYAPDFVAKDLNGITTTLSQFKGDYVILMDFWAVWCIPCVESFPHLITLYDKYHLQGFDIIAVYTDNISSDSKIKTWENAVDRYGIHMWHHVPISENGTNQTTEDDINKNYFIDGIPVSILIDKNGRIIGYWSGATTENKKSLDDKLSEMFD